MPSPLTRHQRRAITTFLAERDALFELLETNRHTPLPDAVAHRGRAALAGVERLLAGTGRAASARVPDTNPVMPADLFIALSQASLALDAFLRATPPPPRPPGNFPRAEPAD